MYSIRNQDFGEARGERSTGKRAGAPADVRRILRALWRGRWWIVAALVGGLAGGYGVAKGLVGHTYKTSATLVFHAVPGAGGRRAPDGRDLSTLVDSVKLPTHLRDVKQRLDLDQPISDIGQRIEVRHKSTSNAFDVVGAASTATEAKELVDTVVDVYMESQKKGEKQRLQNRLVQLDEDIQVARNDLEEARTRYDRFRKQNGIADLPTEREQAIEAAAELRSAADMAQADTQAEEARVNTLENTPRRRPRTGDVRELRQLRTELASARSHYSDKHPRVRALQARLESARQELMASSRSGSSAAVGGKLASSKAEREAAQQRKSSYRELAKEAEKRVSKLSELEGRASQMLARVQVAQKHLTRLQQKRTRLKDLARNPASGFRVSSPAIEPDRPIQSTYRYAAAGAIPGASLIGILLLLIWREFRGLRARTPTEIAYWGGAPVVGATAWPHRPSALDEVVHELDDKVPWARGTTLLVGATPADNEAAITLAERLNDDWSPMELVDLEDRSSAMREVTRHLLPSPQSASGNGTEAAPSGSSPSGSSPAAGQSDVSAITRLHHADPPSSLVYNPGAPMVSAWRQEPSGPWLRRAARLADRVVVLVGSGEMSAAELHQVRTRLGRDDGIGFLVISLDGSLGELPDRVGDVESFWNG